MKYYPHTEEEVTDMLRSIGVSSVDEFFSDIPPDKIIKKLNLPPPMSEYEVVKAITELSQLNESCLKKPSFLGAGSYRHFIPAVVNAVLSRSEFYTSYTPYQAEASQGILQTIFEYQTLICALTGLDVSNASLYDGSTACAEAVSMAINHTGKKEILYSAALHPEYVEVLKTYFNPSGMAILREIPLSEGTIDDKFVEENVTANTAGVIIQNPNCLGFIERAEKISKAVKEKNSKTLFIIAVTEPHSLGILKNPGECGADICIGEGAGLGIPPSFGGPYLGFMAVKAALLRRIPGRLVGQTIDADGKRAFCLTLQAREQHIRRDKAASNICTNEALCALAASVYLSYLGKSGFSALARLNFSRAVYLKDRITSIKGFKLLADRPFFNEFTVKCPDNPVKIWRYLSRHGITGGFVTGKWRIEWADCLTFCVTELNDKDGMDRLADYLESYCRDEVSSECMIN